MDDVSATQDSWIFNIERLRGETDSPLGNAHASLLDSADQAWKSAIVSRTSHFNLLFTLPGDDYPWRASVHVPWADDVYEFQLIRKGGILVTADRCRLENSEAVLDAFLHQLLAEKAPSQ